MDNVLIINKINEIAKEFKSRDEYITRQELAIALSSFGIKDDSLEISRLVWDTYKKYGNSEIIKDRILTNDGQESLVEDYRVTCLIEQGKINEAMTIVVDKLATSEMALEKMENKLQYFTSTSLYFEESNSSFWENLKGDVSIKNITNEATVYYKNYALLVEQYLSTEHAIQCNIRDFLALRAIINEIYTKYISMLKDILGDSLNEIAPELFDFGMIKWLDVKELLKSVELEFGKVLEQSKYLMAAISTSFEELTGQTLYSLIKVGSLFSNSRRSQIASGNVYKACIGTLFSIINHYSDVEVKTNLLKADFEKMKRNLEKDRAQLKADWARIFTIFKTLNNVQIPKARAFTFYSNTVLDSEFKQLIDKIYNNPEIEPLRKKREEAIECIRRCELSMSDHQNNIAFYREMVADLDAIMQAKAPFYNEGISKMPKEPNLFIKIMSLGIVKIFYNNKMSKWYPVYGDAVLEYEALRDERTDKESKCSKYELGLVEDRKKYNNAKEDIRTLSSEMVKGIETSQGVKMEVLQRLNTIIRLLKIGKDIMETKIDKKLTEVVRINEVEALPDISPEIEAKISELVNNISSAAIDASKDMLSEAREEKENINSMIKEDYAKMIAEAEQEGLELKDKTASLEYINVSDMVSEEQLIGAINSAVNIFNSYLAYKKEKSQTDKVTKEYDRQLKELSNQFKKQMDILDNKALFINELLKKINTSEDPEVIKSALLQLGDFNREDLSMEDLDALLRGDMIIEI